MAQYFFDFKSLRPGLDTVASNGVTLPKGLVKALGTTLSTNFEQEISKSGDGIYNWLRNSAAGSGNFTTTAAFGLEGVTAANCQCLVKYVGLQYNGGGFSNDGPSFYCRMAALTGAPDRYELALAGNLTSSSALSRKVISGSPTPILSNSGGRNNKATVGWTRFEVTGTTLRIRSWNDGVSEPGTWDHSGTDSDLAGAGYMMFGFPGGSGTGYGTSGGTRYKLFQLSFGTNGDAAPTSSVRNVSGTVLTPAGVAASGYRVRLYARQTGAFLDETLTNGLGAFAFTTNYVSEVYAIAIDQLGNAWKAQIHDLIVPSP